MSTNDYDSVERPNSMSNIVKTERMKSELERELIQESSVRTFPAASDATTTECSSRKRKKLSGDERINRNRERNRLHARKTRERKKNQTAVLQNRINELNQEGQHLRQMIDEQYTATSLLGLSHGSNNRDVKLMPSALVCGNRYEAVLSEHNWLAGDGSIPGKDSAQKRVRRSGKYSPQERERIRRERNRMHAKKTRDRKKFFLEISNKLIEDMESEARKLRGYLLALEFISEEDVNRAQLRDQQARAELNSFMVHGNDDSGNENSSDSGEEDDDGPEESTDARTLQSDAAARKMEPIAKRHKKVVINHPSDEEPSVSGGSEENEKSSEWSGSNDSSSNQDSSLTGSTSRESGSGSNKNSISEPGESGNSLGDTATSKGSGSSASQLMNGSDSGRAAGDKDEAPQLDYQHLLHHNSNHMQHLLMLQQQNQFGSSFGQHQVHPSHPNYLLLEQYILRNPMIPLRSAAAIDAAKALNLLGFNSSIGVEDGVPSAAGALRAEGEGLVRRKDAGAPSSVNKLSALGELPIDSLLYHPSMVTAPSSMPSSMLSSKTSKSTESSSLPSKGQMRGGLPVVAAGGVFLNSTLAAVTAAATHYDKPYASNSETQQHAKNGSSKGSRSHNGSRSNRI